MTDRGLGSYHRKRKPVCFIILSWFSDQLFFFTIKSSCGWPLLRRITIPRMWDNLSFTIVHSSIITHQMLWNLLVPITFEWKKYSEAFNYKCVAASVVFTALRVSRKIKSLPWKRSSPLLKGFLMESRHSNTPTLLVWELMEAWHNFKEQIISSKELLEQLGRLSENWNYQKWKTKSSQTKNCLT